MQDHSRRCLSAGARSTEPPEAARSVGACLSWTCLYSSRDGLSRFAFAHGHWIGSSRPTHICRPSLVGLAQLLARSSRATPSCSSLGAAWVQPPGSRLYNAVGHYVARHREMYCAGITYRPLHLASPCTTRGLGQAFVPTCPASWPEHGRTCADTRYISPRAGP